MTEAQKPEAAAAPSASAGAIKSVDKTPAKSPHTVVGHVISTKMAKTIVVSVDRQYIHPKYGKRLKRTTNLHAHDENRECAVGDRVEIQECRRLSATKHWKLLKVLIKAPVAAAEANA